MGYNEPEQFFCLSMKLCYKTLGLSLLNPDSRYSSDFKSKTDNTLTLGSRIKLRQNCAGFGWGRFRWDFKATSK